MHFLKGTYEGFIQILQRQKHSPAVLGFHHLVGTGECELVRRVGRQLGQAEIGDLHPPPFVEKDIFRLDVAVDDALVVSKLQGLANLRHDGKGLRRSELTGLHELPQIDAVDVLHEKEVKLARLTACGGVRNAHLAKIVHFLRHDRRSRPALIGQGRPVALFENRFNYEAMEEGSGRSCLYLPFDSIGRVEGGPYAGSVR